MIKIKFDIGGGEIVNTWATIARLNKGYMVTFPNGAFDFGVYLKGRIFGGGK